MAASLVKYATVISEPARFSRVFSAQTTRLLQRKLEHCAGHSVITVVAFCALRGEYHRVVRRFGSVRETLRHADPAAPEHVAHRILNVCSPLALTFSVLSEFLLTNARRFGRLLPSVSKFSGV